MEVTEIILVEEATVTISFSMPKRNHGPLLCRCERGRLTCASWVELKPEDNPTGVDRRADDEVGVEEDDDEAAGVVDGGR